ncbi:hypothetical protein PFISCL1PPCAC_3707, partial [Pristionchus fissidentatus]
AGYGSAFASSYLPSAYQPPTVYQQPVQQLQQLYTSYPLPRPLPPPLNHQRPPQIAVQVRQETINSQAAYVNHPTLLQLSPLPSAYQTLPDRPPDLDSSAAIIQYTTLKRGEGRSPGRKPPPRAPLNPESEESFESFEQRPNAKREESDSDLQLIIFVQSVREELYDDSATASAKENEIAFHAPRGTETTEEPSASEGDESDETLANLFKEQSESGQGSLLGRGYKWIKWAANGGRKKKDSHEDESSSPLKHKCNSVELKQIMEEKMVGSPTASKQLVYSAVRAAFGRSPDVICSRSSFSYIVVSSPLYCEHKKAPSTCFVYFQP